MSYELGLPNSLNSYLNSFIEKALIKIELGFEILTDVKILRVFSKVQAYNGLDRWVDTAFSEEGNASNFRAENSSILTEFKKARFRHMVSYSRGFVGWAEHKVHILFVQMQQM